MSIKGLLLLLSLSIAVSWSPATASANNPGGCAGKGPDVTITDNGDSTPQTREMLLGEGQYYYGGFSLGSGKFEYSLAYALFQEARAQANEMKKTNKPQTNAPVAQ